MPESFENNFDNVPENIYQPAAEPSSYDVPPVSQSDNKPQQPVYLPYYSPQFIYSIYGTPSPKPSGHKRTVKAFLTWAGSLMAIFAVAITLFVISDMGEKVSEKGIPKGGKAESSTIEQKKLPAAPDAKPSEDGPQISSAASAGGFYAISAT